MTLRKHCIALHGTAYFRFELLVPSLQHVSLGLVAPSLEEQHLQTSTSKLAQEPVNFSKNLSLITGLTGLTGLTAWHFSWLRLHETRETRETGTDRLDRKPRRIPPTRETTLTTLVCCNLYFGRALERYAATIIYNIYITSLSSVVRNYIQKSSAAIFRWS